MPLEAGKSCEAVSRNVKTEMAVGRPQVQSVAIALKKAGLNRECPQDRHGMQEVEIIR